FQTFKADALVAKSAPKAEYQKKLTDAGESQYDMIKRLELSEQDHKTLVEHCRARGIQFLSSPFDAGSASFLSAELRLPLLKIASGELTNAPLLLAIAQAGTPIILSTGMSTLADIEEALGVLAFGYASPDGQPGPAAFRECYLSRAGRQALAGKVSLLHCTTEYPAPYDEVNLKAIDTMRQTFGLPVGLSDHTAGIAVPIAAVARGAAIIEKHFTLDRGLPGPDHKASLEPGELKAMVAAIRQVEAALGTGTKVPSAAELKNRAVARKSLVAACDIKAGEPFTAENLTVKRPGTGIAPLHYWEWLGKPADRDYKADERVGN
ncbi:MAG TPA: N-acetylneuraminate synthase, partial [Negativicutes bacterium]|nr:N-acetylneuraminate synthase [Negativicutes bacterium]